MDSQAELYKKVMGWVHKSMQKFGNLSDNKIYFFSTMLSGYFSYRYLKNKELYSEHHGHFNSPKTMFNRTLVNFYLKEVLFRFGFGILFFSCGIFMVKKLIPKEENGGTNTSPSQNKIENLPKQFKFSNEYIEDKMYNNLIDLTPQNENTQSMNESQLSKENEDLLRRKKIVDEYIKKK